MTEYGQFQNVKADVKRCFWRSDMEEDRELAFSTYWGRQFQACGQTRRRSVIW